MRAQIVTRFWMDLLSSCWVTILKWSWFFWRMNSIETMVVVWNFLVSVIRFFQIWKAMVLRAIAQAAGKKEYTIAQICNMLEEVSVFQLGEQVCEEFGGYCILIIFLGIYLFKGLDDGSEITIYFCQPVIWNQMYRCPDRSNPGLKRPYQPCLRPMDLCISHDCTFLFEY